MRNDDLKNKLDQRPISFDREVLWDRIDSETQKDNRRFIWWWFGGLGLFLLMMTLGIKWNTPELKSTISTELIDDQTNELDNDSKNVSSTSRPQTESNDIEKSNDLEVKSNSQINKLKELGDYSQYLIVNTITKVVKQEREINNSSSTLYENGKSHFKAKEQVGTKSIGTSKSQETKLQNELISIPFIQSLGIKQLIANQLLGSQEIIILPAKPKVRFARNGIRIGFGIGSDNHSFMSNDLYDRFGLEKNLESISASINYSRNLYKNFTISSGLTFASSQTNINQSFIRDDVFAKSALDGNTYIITTETKRNLYNKYNKLDATLGVGHNVTFGGWGIEPSLGVGTNILFSYEGDVIDANNNVLELEDLNSYKDKLGLFFYYGINVNRRLGKSIKLGLGAQMQSSRNLGTKENEHVVRPLSLNLYVLKEW